MPELAAIDLGDDGVRLRQPTEDDAPGVLSVHGDPRVYVHDPQEVQADLEDARRFLAPMLRHWAEHGFGYWTVLVPREWWPAGVAVRRATTATGCTPAWVASSTP